MKSSIRFILLVLVVVVAVFVWNASRKTESAIEPQEQAQTQYVSERGVALIVEEPLRGSVVTSPLTIKGEAPGTWYFEATFPIVVVNWDGLIIGEGYAQAQSDWMTTEPVPFVGTVDFKAETWDADFSKNGSLILQRDNPSDLPQNDDALEIPIRFKE
jgi:hypothetical protein